MVNSTHRAQPARRSGPGGKRLSWLLNGGLVAPFMAVMVSQTVVPETAPVPPEEMLTLDDLLQGALAMRHQIDFAGKTYIAPDAQGEEFLIEALPYVGSTIRFGDYTIPENIYMANLETALVNGLPLALILGIQSAESSFNPDSLNGNTHACGLAQLVPSTRNELVYRYGDQLGYAEAADMVERRNTAAPGQAAIFEYVLADERDEDRMLEICFDPEFGIDMKAQYLIQIADQMQTRLARFAPEGMDYYPLTTAELYLGYFGGYNRAIDMISDMHTGGTAGSRLAASYFSADKISQNPTYLGPNRTVRQFLDFLADGKGLGRDTLPDYRDWQQPERSDIVHVNNAAAVLGRANAQIEFVIPYEFTATMAPATMVTPVPRPVI